MKARIEAVEYFLPQNILSNEDLSKEYPEWSVEKIFKKTGIMNRHIAGINECASDLGLAAAEKALAVSGVSRKDIDYIILCTQSPDYFLPTTACIIQHKLNIPVSCGALDINLGCSGFVYGLSLAKGIIESGQARNVLLITSETYSKYINKGDRSVRTIFGDGASATILTSVVGNIDFIGPFVFGTDGAGSGNLIVPAGGSRKPRSAETGIEKHDESGCVRSEDNIYMNGAEVFSFTLDKVPAAMDELLRKCGKSKNEIDLFVFHQANKYMLETLVAKCGIPEDKFILALENTGNTVSSSIPIALKEAVAAGRLVKGMQVLLIGFGVGYSWSACIVEW